MHTGQQLAHLAGVGAGYPPGMVQGADMGGAVFQVGRGYNLQPYGFEKISQVLGGRTSLMPNRGDRIYVRRGHTEEIAAAGDLDLDKAGVHIIGQGSRAKRPKIRITTAASARLRVTADDVTLENFDIVVEKDAVTAAIDVQAFGFTLRNCAVDIQTPYYEYLIGLQATARAISSCTIVADPHKGLTSATAVWTQADVGRQFYLVSGTNATAGWYTVATVGTDGKSLTTTAPVGIDTGTDIVISFPRADFLTIDGCELQDVTSDTAAATECIELAGATRNFTLYNSVIKGLFSVSAVSAITAPSKDLAIVGNYINNNQATAIADIVDLVAGSTGFIDKNHCLHLDTAAGNHLTCIDGASCIVGQNWISDVAGERGDLAVALNVDT